MDLADLSGDLHTLIREYVARGIFQTRAEIDIFLGIMIEVKEFLKNPEAHSIGPDHAMKEARGSIKEKMREQLDFTIDIYNDPHSMGMSTTARAIFDCLSS